MSDNTHFFTNAEEEMRSQGFELESRLAELKSMYTRLEARLVVAEAEKQVSPHWIVLQSTLFLLMFKSCSINRQSWSTCLFFMFQT